MFENIGGKIKGLAKAAFIVVAIAAVIMGIALIAYDEDLTATGLLMMVLGPFVAWILSWFLYGFGEIIEAVTKIEINTRDENSTKEENNTRDEITENQDMRYTTDEIQKINNEIENLLSQGLITEEEYKQVIIRNQ